MKTAWRSNYQICVYASHLRPFSPFWLPHCDHLTFRLSAWPLEGRNRLLSNTPLSLVLFIPVSAYILQFCIPHPTFFLLNFRSSNFCPVGFFDSPILLYLTHLHPQPRVCPLPLLGDSRQLDLTTIKYLDDSPPPIQVVRWPVHSDSTPTSLSSQIAPKSVPKYLNAHQVSRTHLLAAWRWRRASLHSCIR